MIHARDSERRPKGLVGIWSLFVNVYAKPSKAEVCEPFGRNCIIATGCHALVQRIICTGEVAGSKSRTACGPEVRGTIQVGVEARVASKGVKRRPQLSID